MRGRRFTPGGLFFVRQALARAAAVFEQLRFRVIAWPISGSGSGQRIPAPRTLDRVSDGEAEERQFDCVGDAVHLGFMPPDCGARRTARCGAAVATVRPHKLASIEAAIPLRRPIPLVATPENRPRFVSTNKRGSGAAPSADDGVVVTGLPA